MNILIILIKAIVTFLLFISNYLLVSSQEILYNNKPLLYTIPYENLLILEISLFFKEISNFQKGNYIIVYLTALENIKYSKFYCSIFSKNEKIVILDGVDSNNFSLNCIFNEDYYIKHVCDTSKECDFILKVILTMKEEINISYLYGVRIFYSSSILSDTLTYASSFYSNTIEYISYNNQLLSIYDINSFVIINDNDNFNKSNNFNLISFSNYDLYINFSYMNIPLQRILILIKKEDFYTNNQLLKDYFKEKISKDEQFLYINNRKIENILEKTKANEVYYSIITNEFSDESQNPEKNMNEVEISRRYSLLLNENIFLYIEINNEAIYNNTNTFGNSTNIISTVKGLNIKNLISNYFHIEKNQIISNIDFFELNSNNIIRGVFSINNSINKLQVDNFKVELLSNQTMREKTINYLYYTVKINEINIVFNEKYNYIFSIKLNESEDKTKNNNTISYFLISTCEVDIPKLFNIDYYSYIKCFTYDYMTTLYPELVEKDNNINQIFIFIIQKKSNIDSDFKIRYINDVFIFIKIWFYIDFNNSSELLYPITSQDNNIINIDQDFLLSYYKELSFSFKILFLYNQINEINEISNIIISNTIQILSTILLNDDYFYNYLVLNRTSLSLNNFQDFPLLKEISTFHLLDLDFKRVSIYNHNYKEREEFPFSSSFIIGLYSNFTNKTETDSTQIIPFYEFPLLYYYNNNNFTISEMNFEFTIYFSSSIGLFFPSNQSECKVSFFTYLNSFSSEMFYNSTQKYYDFYYSHNKVYSDNVEYHVLKANISSDIHIQLLFDNINKNDIFFINIIQNCISILSNNTYNQYSKYYNNPFSYYSISFEIDLLIDNMKFPMRDLRLIRFINEKDSFFVDDNGNYNLITCPIKYFYYINNDIYLNNRLICIIELTSHDIFNSLIESNSDLYIFLSGNIKLLDVDLSNIDTYPIDMYDINNKTIIENEYILSITNSKFSENSYKTRKYSQKLTFLSSSIIKISIDSIKALSQIQKIYIPIYCPSLIQSKEITKNTSSISLYVRNKENSIQYYITQNNQNSFSNEYLFNLIQNSSTSLINISTLKWDYKTKSEISIYNSNYKIKNTSVNIDFVVIIANLNKVEYDKSNEISLFFENKKIFSQRIDLNRRYFIYNRNKFTLFTISLENEILLPNENKVLENVFDVNLIDFNRKFPISDTSLLVLKGLVIKSSFDSSNSRTNNSLYDIHDSIGLFCINTKNTQVMLTNIISIYNSEIFKDATETTSINTNSYSYTDKDQVRDKEEGKEGINVNSQSDIYFIIDLTYELNSNWKINLENIIDNSNNNIYKSDVTSIIKASVKTDFNMNNLLISFESRNFLRSTQCGYSINIDNTQINEISYMNNFNYHYLYECSTIPFKINTFNNDILEQSYTVVCNINNDYKNYITINNISIICYNINSKYDPFLITSFKASKILIDKDKVFNFISNLVCSAQVFDELSNYYKYLLDMKQNTAITIDINTNLSIDFIYYPSLSFSIINEEKSIGIGIFNIKLPKVPSRNTIYEISSSKIELLFPIKTSDDMIKEVYIKNIGCYVKMSNKMLDNDEIEGKITENYYNSVYDNDKNEKSGVFIDPIINNGEYLLNSCNVSRVFKEKKITISTKNIIYKKNIYKIDSNYLIIQLSPINLINFNNKLVDIQIKSFINKSQSDSEKLIFSMKDVIIKSSSVLLNSEIDTFINTISINTNLQISLVEKKEFPINYNNLCMIIHHSSLFPSSYGYVDVGINTLTTHSQILKKYFLFKNQSYINYITLFFPNSYIFNIEKIEIEYNNNLYSPISVYNLKNSLSIFIPEGIKMNSSKYEIIRISGLRFPIESFINPLLICSLGIKSEYSIKTIIKGANYSQIYKKFLFNMYSSESNYIIPIIQGKIILNSIEYTTNLSQKDNSSIIIDISFLLQDNIQLSQLNLNKKVLLTIVIPDYYIVFFNKNNESLKILYKNNKDVIKFEVVSFIKNVFYIRLFFNLLENSILINIGNMQLSEQITHQNEYDLYEFSISSNDNLIYLSSTIFTSSSLVYTFREYIKGTNIYNVSDNYSSNKLLIVIKKTPETVFNKRINLNNRIKNNIYEKKTFDNLPYSNSDVNTIKLIAGRYSRYEFGINSKNEIKTNTIIYLNNTFYSYINTSDKSYVLYSHLERTSFYIGSSCFSVTKNKLLLRFEVTNKKDFIEIGYINTKVYYIKNIISLYTNTDYMSRLTLSSLADIFYIHRTIDSYIFLEFEEINYDPIRIYWYISDTGINSSIKDMFSLENLLIPEKYQLNEYINNQNKEFIGYSNPLSYRISLTKDSVLFLQSKLFPNSIRIITEVDNKCFSLSKDLFIDSKNFQVEFQIEQSKYIINEYQFLYTYIDDINEVKSLNSNGYIFNKYDEKINMKSYSLTETIFNFKLEKMSSLLGNPLLNNGVFNIYNFYSLYYSNLLKKENILSSNQISNSILFKSFYRIPLPSTTTLLSLSSFQTHLLFSHKSFSMNYNLICTLVCNSFSDEIMYINEKDFINNNCIMTKSFHFINKDVNRFDTNKEVEFLFSNLTIGRSYRIECLFESHDLFANSKSFYYLRPNIVFDIRNNNKVYYIQLIFKNNQGKTLKKIRTFIFEFLQKHFLRYGYEQSGCVDINEVDDTSLVFPILVNEDLENNDYLFSDNNEVRNKKKDGELKEYKLFNYGKLEERKMKDKSKSTIITNLNNEEYLQNLEKIKELNTTYIEENKRRLYITQYSNSNSNLINTTKIKESNTTNSTNTEKTKLEFNFNFTGISFSKFEDKFVLPLIPLYSSSISYSNLIFGIRSNDNCRLNDGDLYKNVEDLVNLLNSSFSIIFNSLYNRTNNSVVLYINHMSNVENSKNFSVVTYHLPDIEIAKYNFSLTERNFLKNNFSEVLIYNKLGNQVSFTNNKYSLFLMNISYDVENGFISFISQSKLNQICFFYFIPANFNMSNLNPFTCIYRKGIICGLFKVEPNQRQFYFRNNYTDNQSYEFKQKKVEFKVETLEEYYEYMKPVEKTYRLEFGLYKLIVSCVLLDDYLLNQVKFFNEFDKKREKYEMTKGYNIEEDEKYEKIILFIQSYKDDIYKNIVGSIQSIYENDMFLYNTTSLDILYRHFFYDVIYDFSKENIEIINEFDLNSKSNYTKTVKLNKNTSSFSKQIYKNIKNKNIEYSSSPEFILYTKIDFTYMKNLTQKNMTNSSNKTCDNCSNSRKFYIYLDSQLLLVVLYVIYVINI